MKHAFSLVELSIVLVILGLLTGGILTGQSLIRAAELRSVTTEFQTYQTAVQTFRDKYFAIPGDMTNATDFWGSMTNCSAASPSGSGTQTCNGNGDGTVNYGAANQTAESFTFWQHLANAGLIEGTYTGIAGTSPTDAILGENSPQSKLSSAGWTARDLDTTSGSVNYYFHDYGHVLVFGATIANFDTVAEILTPEETWNIDTKIDDARPGHGNVMARWPNCTEAANNTDFDAGYNLDSTSIQCSIVFKNAF